MKIVSLFIPGRFEDAHLYMGRLIILTEGRGLRIFNLEEVVDSMQGQLSNGRPVPKMMFLRNDWIANEQFRSFIEGRAFSRSLETAFEQFPQPFLELSERNVEYDEYDLPVSAHVLLDTTIYNGRLYIGADTGFYDVELDWDTGASFLPDQPENKRLDARCVGISAKYGAVNASCGDEGLFTAIGEFDGTNRTARPRLEKIVDKSLKSGWMSYDVINYATFSQPLLLRTTHERHSRNIEHEATVVTGWAAERISLDKLINQIREKEKIERDDIQYMFNSNSVVFIQTSNGDFFSLGLTRESHGEPRVRFTKTHKGPENRILSASPTRAGLVIETESRVLLFANGIWSTIVDSEVLAVRTFMRSRRYQNLVAITKDDGLLLSGLFDESNLRL